MTKSKTGLVICRLCLEPLYNFICIDCLLDSTKQWLHKRGASDLIPAVEQRHEQIKSFLYSDFNSVTCIKCKQESDMWACPCCYLYEIYLIVKKYRPDLAKRFERIFNFDFHYRHGFTQLTFWQSLHRQPISTKNFEPVIDIDLRDRTNSRTDLNICELCGQASDDLKQENGEWLCEDCRDDRRD
jgi:hypothetical protein